MKKFKRILTILVLTVLVLSALCVPALAITESEVEAQVASSGKEAVTGNVLIWFLCAVAFLKVSQKIDSFMATLGVNVGRTGGSMLAEAMIAVRAVTMVAGGGRGAGAGRTGSAAGSTAGKSGSSGMAGFFKGGLIGMAGRHITNSAVRTATTQTSAVHTAQNQVRQAAASSAASAAQTAAQVDADTHINSEVHAGGSPIHTENSTPVGTPPQADVIQTDNVTASPAVPMENVPPIAPMPGGTPPQEGVILTGSEPPAPVPPSSQMPQAVDMPPTSLAPGGTPPQEGVVLTGSEPPAPVPPAGPPQTVGTPPESIPVDSVPQTVVTPPESIPADSVPPQEGIVITGGENTVHAPQTENVYAGGAEGSVHRENTVVSGGEQRAETHMERSSQTVHTTSSSERVHTNRFQAGAGARPTLGGMVFSHSLAAGGSFANDIIGTVARGEVAGSITGDMAAQSLTSYMGYTAIRETARDVPVYSDVEIGRGRITGVETTAGSTTGLPFAMYHVDQYAAPSGEFQKVFTADGTQWYKQYAQDSVERKPYMATDDTVAYHEKIVKKMPDPPRRKDRM